MEKLPQRENWPSLVWEICPCGKIYTLNSQGRVLRENYPCGKFTQNPWVNFPIAMMGKVPQWENLPSLVYAKFAPVGNLPTGANSPKYIDPGWVLREIYPCGKTYRSSLALFSHS